MSDGSDPPRESYSVIGVAFTAGLTLLAGMFVGYYGGRYLDGLLGTDPWITLAGTLLGVVAGFRVLLREILRSPGATSGRKTRAEPSDGPGTGRAEEADGPRGRRPGGSDTPENE